MAFCGCLILLVHCVSLCDRRLQVGEVEREVEYRIVLPCTSMLASACNLLPRVRLAGSRPYVRQLIRNKLLFSSIIKIAVRSKGAARRPLAFYYR